MKHKVSELEGALLDAAVVKALEIVWHGRIDWQMAGPIIEQERIAISPTAERIGEPWEAFHDPEDGYDGLESDSPRMTGATPIIAAMRCFVASKLGDEVDL